MASGFIGISVIVTLQNPPNTLVHGVVAAVNPQNATLTLQDVFFPASGHRLNSYNVEGHAIADIKVNVPAPAAHQPPPPRANTQPYAQYPANQAHQAPRPPIQQYGGPSAMQHPAAGIRQPAAQPAPFVDPAILSMGKRAPQASGSGLAVTALPQEAPATPIKPPTATTNILPPAKSSSPFTGSAKRGSIRKQSAATLAGPFSSLDIADAEEADSETKTAMPTVRRASINKTRNGKPMEDVSPQKNDEGGKRTRRGGKSRKKELAAQERRNGGDNPTKGNGWRSTPMLQAVEEPQTRTPGVIAGRVGLEAANASARKSRRQKALDATNGWATEDATDVQDMPEFDFQANLSKFDKRTVFDQIRNEDTTADEDRLVSFNRLARPGTHGGKNLHPTENVLDSSRLKSTTNTSSDDDSDLGSRNSRRAMSRASVSAKRAPTRQGSGIQAGHLEMLGSGLLPRNNRSLIGTQYASSHGATGSPKLGKLNTPPDSPFDTSSKGCLRLVTNNRKCHTVTPGGMLAVEETAEVEFGLTEELIAESAGRGIAEITLKAINPGGQRLARENLNARPVIVVLAGNHRGGARGIAAARHLLARGPKVMVALLGFERNADWDRDVRRQVDLFKKFGGSVRTWADTEVALKRLQAPPELIIDALLGRHKEFDALGESDRATTLSIVGWANKSRAAVLAVETPSGVAGSTGEVAILEGEPLEVRAKYIVCLGAPRSGLVRALQNGAGRDPAWSVWLVDIGVNKPWRNAGISGGKGIKFDEHWVVQARYPATIAKALDSNWAIAEVLLSSSYRGWGTSSLQKDATEIAQCVEYFQSLRPGRKIVLMGHSTGCQDVMEYVVGKGSTTRPPINGAILQAGVSDREAWSFLLESPEEKASCAAVLKEAERLIAAGKPKEMVPRENNIVQKELGAAISAYRTHSLLAKGGDDDYFSTDLDDETLKGTFGRFPKEMRHMMSRPTELPSGHIRIRPDLDKIALLLKQGCEWARTIKTSRELATINPSSSSKRSATEAFGDDAAEDKKLTKLNRKVA
ncbi:enhancer of mRNA decapping [Curvularia kusanoi]|uniref:Enhancer of mRNA-decapping protein 3 n=1 Tax=Curvularia kusanoi TaxID=90978 RepID=A0A9P4TNQ6_CURKU|nr:enhancer of mRNA decapping [Curvularia kusanoi]